MYNKEIFVSIDPGEQGALTLFKASKREFTIDYNLKEYYSIFCKYKPDIIGIEEIKPYPHRVLPYGSLKENVGKIKGAIELSGCNSQIIEVRTVDWKRPYGGLSRKKGEVWSEYEEKIRCINKCKELYPDIDIPYVRTVHHKDGTTTIYYKDGRADSCMIGDYILHFYKGKENNV